ncbi:cyanophycin synthetase [Thermanaeromonas toyohensis ToBE]|uniref:Cyanophycin synthetase n=1 Tax=Thermanaeromonas toyohensis ToBE TaxID=698762 RepID=A0A1W1V7W5_9FIRM|nr:cyanophycin synthetase [Thermanaeromonas toyohensis]SMB89432.1 cyanophycin synthetase [Thermanaeromonas toyohensis ToBE]
MKILDFRALEGPNIFCLRPVLVARLDLGNYAEVNTGQILSFGEKLMATLPGLKDHHCSRGYKGGFQERLLEGTYLGHVVEHVALELLWLAGEEVSYGKTRHTQTPGLVEIILEYSCKKAAETALGLAVDLVLSLLQEKDYNVQATLKRLKEVLDKHRLGPSTEAIVAACRRRGIPVRPLGEGSLLQLGYGCRSRRIWATITENTSCLAVDIARDKALTKKLLKEFGLPVPRGLVVESPEEAVTAAHELGFPVVVKPLHGNQGKGVFTNLKKASEVRRAYREAAAYGPVLVEEHLPGRQYRLLVVKGKFIAASERLPAQVVGDGQHSIRELIKLANLDPARGEGHDRPLTRLPLDSLTLFTLRRQGWSLEDIPPKGTVILLRESANLSTGGTAVDVTDRVHPRNAELAIEAARIIGLDVAGVDMICPDITRPLTTGGGGIVEVNAAPGIRMHHFPTAGQPRDAAAAIVESLFPPGDDGRIPIVSITGTNGKTTTARLIAYILGLTGLTVGLTTTDGIYIGGRLVEKGDAAGPASARRILADRRVEVAVLETARGGILRAGLAYDRADVGIVLNVSEDHLGQYGVETLEDLAYVKSLVVETVKEDGWSVLNADDPLTARMRDQARGKVIFFSLNSRNPIVVNHLTGGGTAVYTQAGYIFIAQGSLKKRLLPVSAVTCAFKGLARHNLQNALAAVAACLALNIPFSTIARGLKEFGRVPEHNPGRLMFQEIGGVKVIIDYGHNPAGFESVLKLARQISPEVIGVIGVPGDRPDSSILKSGMVAGRFCYRLVIKEDKDRRGRNPGEVASLLHRGALAAGLSPERIEVELKEKEAVNKALMRARPGQVVAIFYEELEVVCQVVNRFKSEKRGFLLDMVYN